MDIDKKVESVRKIEGLKEMNAYEARRKVFKGYMSELGKKTDKTLLKVADKFIPFSLGGLAVSAGGSFLGVSDQEINLTQALEIVGKTGLVEASAAMGIVVATVAAISVNEAIKFTSAYLNYPKNKEELIRLGMYNKLEDKLNIMNQEQETRIKTEEKSAGAGEARR